MKKLVDFMDLIELNLSALDQRVVFEKLEAFSAVNHIVGLKFLHQQRESEVFITMIV
jgi:hypothetical protein